MLKPPDSSFIYQRMASYTHRPLDISTIVLLGQQIHRIAERQQIPWALIGGAAVALHLEAFKHPAAETRCSCDLDVAALEVPSDRHITWISPLLAGGMIGKLGTRRIDWLVRKGAHEPLRFLQCRLIGSAVRLKSGMPVASPDALCALKLCIAPKGFRPKDRWDCRLLIDVGAATISGINQWIAETVSNREIRESSLRNLERLDATPLAAA